MINKKSKKWYYDMTIETWNYIAENDCAEWDTPQVKKYLPNNYSFACEYYLSENQGCGNCPFNIEFGGCYKAKSPESMWIYNIVDHHKRQKYAIEIAQLFINYYNK